MDYYLNDKVLIKDRNIKGTVVDIININVQSAGFKIGNEMFDLKSAEGSGKHTLYGMVKGKEEQANNSIFDISKSGLTEDEAIDQIENDIYRFRHTRFVKK